MRLKFAILALMGPLSPYVSAAKSDAFSAIIRRAAETQIDWLAAKTELEKARLQENVTRSSFLPDLRLESSFSYDYQTSARNQESVGSRAGIESKWTIYDNGASWREFKIKKLNTQLAKIQEQSVRDRVVFESLNRFSSAWIARRRREITERRLALLNSQFSLTETQFRQGLKARRDFQRLKSETQRARLDLERQSNLEKDTLEELQRFLGLRDALSWGALGEFSAEQTLTQLRAPQLPKDQGKALGVLSAQVQTEISQITLNQTKATLWPELSFGVGAAYGSDDFTSRGTSWSDQERFSTQANIGLSWMLWDWMGRRSSNQQNVLGLKLSHKKMDQSQIDFLNSLGKLERERLRLEKSVGLVRDIYNIELSTFKDIESEYREGRASYLDLISSLDRRTQAELDLEQETQRAILNLAEYYQLSGDLYATIVDN